jgi:glutamine cyclotransferase
MTGARAASLLRIGALAGAMGAIGSTPSAGRAATGAVQGIVKTLKVDVVRAYPHDPRAFTQGLLLHNGTLYESTGLVGRSSLRQVELATGRVLRQADVAAPVFGEGLALAGDRLVMLTWQHGRAMVYSRATFGQVGEFAYQGEGWGLSHNGKALVMSNGTSQLTVRSDKDFSVQRTIAVTQNGAPVDRLNELECVAGDIYANVWTTDTIVRIDAATGKVTARIDASGLLSPMERFGVDVLNGIAYDPADGTFLITGKLWPKLFRVRFAG